jgi:hypothetical protein
MRRGRGRRRLAPCGVGVTVVGGGVGRRWRWLPVVVAVAAVVALPVVVRGLPVRAPGVGAARLYGLIRASGRQPYQGYAVSDGTLGLPALPQLADVAAALSGRTQLRAWYAAADRWRVDQISTGAERDVYRTGGAEVTWDFGTRIETRTIGLPPVRLPRGADLVPPELARRLLSTAAPIVTSASGATGGSRLVALPGRRVAGVDAAGIRVVPVSGETTVGHVDVWADPATGLPLEVEVVGRGAVRAALVSRFEEVSTRAPAGSVLVPPAGGAGVALVSLGAPDVLGTLVGLGLGELPGELAGRARSDTTFGLPVGTYGTGFDRFVVVSVPRRTGFAAYDMAVKGGGTVRRLPGGEAVLLATPLISVLVMDSDPARRTYLLAGLTAGAVLSEAADQLSTYLPVPEFR